MKNHLIKIFFCSLWILGILSLNKNSQGIHIVRRAFIRWGKIVWTLPGVEMSRLNQDFSSESFFVRFLQAHGYEFRATIDQIPDTIYFVKSSQNPLRLELNSREEIATTFTGSESQSLVSLNADFARQRAAAFEREKNVRVALLIVPSKSFANDLEENSWEIPLHDRKLSGISLLSAQTTKLENQKTAENNFRSHGQPFVSLIDLFKTIKKRAPDRPLYPYAESHWSRLFLPVFADEIVHQLVTVLKIPELCYKRHQEAFEDSFSDPLKASYLGDYGLMLQLSENLSLFKRLLTPMTERDLRTYKVPAADPNCPPVVYIGTSFGTNYAETGSIADAMRLHYRGEIQNRAVPALGPLRPLERQLKESFPHSARVLWEFPIRHLLLLRPENTSAISQAPPQEPNL